MGEVKFRNPAPVAFEALTWRHVGEHYRAKAKDSHDSLMLVVFALVFHGKHRVDDNRIVQ